MDIKNLTSNEILAQIKYLERNISNGSATYRTNRMNRLRTLRAGLHRLAS